MDIDSCHSSVVNVKYNLRKKFDPDNKNPAYLKTVLGISYKFSADNIGFSICSNMTTKPGRSKRVSDIPSSIKCRIFTRPLCFAYSSNICFWLDMLLFSPCHHHVISVHTML